MHIKIKSKLNQVTDENSSPFTGVGIVIAADDVARYHWLKIDFLVHPWDDHSEWCIKDLGQHSLGLFFQPLTGGNKKKNTADIADYSYPIICAAVKYKLPNIASIIKKKKNHL